jgi:alpha-tubulin suppressor-like RCC1 family protein
VNNSNVTSYTGTYSGDDYTNCLIEQCENNYSKSLDEKSCIENTRACLVSDLINQTGVETVSGNYGLATNDSSNCTIDTCQTEFNLNNDVCEPAIIPDTPLNIDNSGQLGVGLDQSSQLQSLIPIAVDDSLLGQAKMISAYSGHVCAIRKSDDKLFCWGRNNFGQLGNNSTNDSLVPTAVDDSVLGAVAYVSVGGNFTCAIRKIDNKLFCWGTNSYGRLGINNSNTDTSSSFPVPTAVDSSLLSRVSYVELGGSHACAIRRDDDKLFCWGRNNWGQIGNNGELTDIFISPALVADNVLNAVSTVSAGPSSTCALRKSDGKPYCWGSNQFEMLGLGSTVTRITSPSAVVDTLLGASSEIKVGFSHSCAIKASNNKVYCWGRRFNGSIGDGSTQQFVNVSTPSLIDDSLLDAASQLDVSNTFSCAIKNSDNQLFCWGGNGDGQLGDGTQNNRFSPRAVDQTNL